MSDLGLADLVTEDVTDFSATVRATTASPSPPSSPQNRASVSPLLSTAPPASRHGSQVGAGAALAPAPASKRGATVSTRATTGALRCQG